MRKKRERARPVSCPAGGERVRVRGGARTQNFAVCAQFDTPAQKIGGRMLTALEQLWNSWLQLPRSRIEHLNTVIKNHAMFNGAPFRGWVQNLAVFVKITLHVTAEDIRQRRRVFREPRYAGFGWWKHGFR